MCRGISMKMYNFKRYSGSKRLFRGFIYTLPIAIFVSLLLGLIQNSIRLQLSLSYLLISYIIANCFRKFGKSVTIEASYISVLILFISVILIDVFTLFGTSIPPVFALIQLLPTVIINKINISSVPAIINLLIIIYSINYVFNNSRIV